MNRYLKFEHSDVKMFTLELWSKFQKSLKKLQFILKISKICRMKFQKVKTSHKVEYIATLHHALLLSIREQPAKAHRE